MPQGETAAAPWIVQRLVEGRELCAEVAAAFTSLASRNSANTPPSHRPASSP